VSFDFRMKVAALRLRLEQRGSELGTRAERLLRVKRERLDRVRLLLEERSPLRVLERGYAIATDAHGNVLRDAAQVALGAPVNVQLARGRLTTEVKSKNEK
jgi:exodeoxyribonuclease VII large subunit